MIQRGTPTQFYNTFIANTATVVHEVVEDTTVLINYLSFHNTDGSPVDIEIWVVPEGESPGDEFRRFAETIASLDTLEYINSTPWLLKEGDTLQAIASAPSVVSTFCSGVLLELA